MKINNSMTKRLRVFALAMLAIFGLATCAKNPVTGRRIAKSDSDDDRRRFRGNFT